MPAKVVSGVDYPRCFFLREFGPEVTEQSRTQVSGFSYVDDLPGRVDHHVDTRAVFRERLDSAL